MSAHSLVVDVSAVTAYPAAPQLLVPFVPDEYLLANESPAAAILFSFDGVNDHGKLTPNKPTEAISWRTKAQRLWFKRVAGGGSATVRAMASTDV